MNQIPSAPGTSIILVVPFYNESPNIPFFMSSLKKNYCNQLYLLGVNHNSTDNSAQLFFDSASNFGRLDLVSEKSLTPSVGIPRSKGLEIAVEFAKEENKKGKKVVIGTIDIDSTVSPTFLLDAYTFSQTDKDFLIFPARYDQSIFLKCVKM